MLGRGHVDMEETHSEKRSAGLNLELIPISEELKKEMTAAFQSANKDMGDHEGDEGDSPDNFRPYDQKQDFFVSVSKKAFLDAEHPAAVIDSVVELLDLSEVYADYAKEGNSPYHPKMMLKVLFYAYYCGIMSCRTIWDQVVHRADFIYLAAGQVPNFRTINSFRLRHLERLPALFTQIVYLCGNLGLIGFEHLAIDGQKIEANASFRRSKNLKQVKKEYEKTKQGLEKLLGKEVSEVFPAEKKDKRTKRLEKQLKELESFQKELEQLEDEDARLNMTDRDAKVMRHKDGSSTPSYTHQSAVDDAYGVVTAVQTTCGNDRSEDLLPLVDQSKSNCGKGHKAITADCGFCDYPMLEEVEVRREEDFYLPDRRYDADKKKELKEGRYGQKEFRELEDGGYICPAGRQMEYKGICALNKHQVHHYVGSGCDCCEHKDRCTKGKERHLYINIHEPYRKRMREKLSSDKGREMYMKRQGTVEPVHGDDQKNKGWIQHHLRSLEKAAGEFLLIRIATNLGKIVKFSTAELLAMAPG
jgi:transposase